MDVPLVAPTWLVRADGHGLGQVARLAEGDLE
jgi:hypothetical protein